MYETCAPSAVWLRATFNAARCIFNLGVFRGWSADVCASADAVGVIPDGHGNGVCYGDSDGAPRWPGHHTLQHAYR